ncbi:MAG: DUF1631 domain-containing protein [Pseudomonadales bacterium]|nr:DUF1631 domain-containing protein [Pseudomonadales bacterium]
MDVTDKSQATKTDKLSTGKVSPAVLDNIAERAIGKICSYLAELFEQIDDTLFDLADRAHHNSEQSLYFESMRIIRLHRNGAQKVFKQSLENNFQRLRSSGESLFSAEEVEAETLALVDSDEMETEVAINNMVHRARCDLPAPLLQLNTRLNTVLPKNKTTEDNNPLDPKQIVKAFTHCAQDIDLDLKVRLILYKEFERQVLKRLDEVLYEANQVLINAGVLPDIRASLARSTSNKIDDEKQAEPQTAAEESAKADSPVHFDTLQSLLSATDNLQQKSIYIQSDPTQPALTQHTLFDWLSSIQAQHIQDPHALLDNDPQAVAVRQEVFDLIKAAGANDPHNRLQKIDDNVINVVDMIFEFILDQDIPSPMAALIGRLQIPILKIAIRDKNFFDSHQHPARRLLNEIAHASIGWQPEGEYQNDPLYKKVATTVRKVLKTEHPDVALFTELENEFRSYVEGESKRTERLAERTAATEEGLATTEVAKKLIEQVIRDRIHGKELPPVVVNFLTTPWQKYLLQVHLKFGKQSEAWRQGLKTADDLIWSVQMHTEKEPRQRWIKLIPKLLEELQEALDKIAHSPADTDKTMTELWQIHSKMLAHKGDKSPIETVKVDLTSEQTQTNISPLVKRKVNADTIRQLRQLVGAFEVGDWFEFTQVDGNRIRCRLIRKIRANDSFVFANRYGAKAKAITRDQLALYIHDEKARVLESGPLIDRALQAIMLRLKNSLP